MFISFEAMESDKEVCLNDNEVKKKKRTSERNSKKKEKISGD